MPPALSSELSIGQLALCAKGCPELHVPASNGSGKIVRAKKCCFCQQVKRMGAGRTDHALIEHMRSKACRNAQRRSVAGVPKPELKQSSSHSPSPSEWQLPAPPLTQQSKHSSPHYGDFDLPLAYPPLEPSNVVPGLTEDSKSASDSDTLEPHSPSRFSSPLRVPIPDTLAVASFAGPEPVRGLLDILARKPCPGTRIDYGVSMFQHYPWHLHDTGILPYKLCFVDPNGQFFRMKSLKCDGDALKDGSACDPCSRLALGEQFRSILKKIAPGNPPSPSPVLNNQYRTYAQLSDLVREKSSQLNDLRLQLVNSRRRIESLSNRLSSRKQMESTAANSDEADELIESEEDQLVDVDQNAGAIPLGVKKRKHEEELLDSESNVPGLDGQ